MIESQRHLNLQLLQLRLHRRDALLIRFPVHILITLLRKLCQDKNLMFQQPIPLLQQDIWGEMRQFEGCK